MIKKTSTLAALYNLSDVPCGGCTHCCHADAVRLLPGDEPSQYKTEPHPHIPGALILAHSPNGDCVYLGPEGCAIHTTKPLMCREFDCRRIAQTITWTKARQMETNGLLRMNVWQRGKELLRCIERIESSTSLNTEANHDTHPIP